MRAAGLRLICKSVQMSYDKHGNKYDVPVFVINEPERYAVARAEAVHFTDAVVSVR